MSPNNRYQLDDTQKYVLRIARSIIFKPETEFFESPTDCVIYAQKWSTFYTEPIKDKIKIILFQFVDIRFHYLVNNIVFLFCLSFIP